MEIWKDIYFTDENGNTYDFRGKYQVSNLGRVKSLDVVKTYLNNGTLCSRTFKGKILSTRITHNGYLRVRLWNRPNSYDFFVHRLVAYMFLEEKNIGGKQINHKDENKENNNVENLEWVTPHENCVHGTRIERIKQTKEAKKCND
jgi:hypothetical protein